MSRRLATIGLAVCAAVLWARGASAQPAAAAKQDKQTPEKKRPAKSARAAGKTQPGKKQSEKKPAQTKSAGNKAPEKPAPAATAPAPEPGAVTRAEAEALAKRIDAAAAKGDLTVFSEAVDDHELMSRTLKGITLTPRARAAVAAMPDISDTLAHGIRLETGPGKWRFVRVVTRPGDEQPRLLFRNPTFKGLDYHELHLHRDASGAVRVADLHEFAVGELLSGLLRGRLLPALVKDGVQLTAEEQERAGAEPSIRQLRPLVDNKQYAEAMAVYERLPQSQKGRKYVAILKVHAAGGLGREAFAAALDEYRKRFPDGAEIETVVIEVLFQGEDYDGVLAAVDRLDKRVGGDPYLDVVRATCAAAKGDVEAARAMLRKLVETEPSLADGYEALAAYALVAGDYAEVGSLMTAGTREAGAQWSELQQMEEFAAFAKSGEYAKWKAAQASGPQAPGAPEGDGLE